MKLRTIAKKSIIFMVLSTFLAACQTTARTYPLEAKDVRSYALSGVNIEILSEENINWGKYKKQRKLIEEGKPINYRDPNKNSELNDDVSSTNNAPQTPQKDPVYMTADEHRDKMIIMPLKTAMAKTFNEFMVGDQKVRAEVQLHSAYIAPTNGTSRILADFTLFDVNTNTVLASKNNHEVTHETTGRRAYYGGSLAAILIATAIDVAASAAISQAGKNKRFSKMSDKYSTSIRDWMAPNLKPKPPAS